MNKKFSKIVAVALALFMCMALAVPTLALNGSPLTDGKAVSTSIEIPVYLIMGEDANVPETTINFTVESAIPPEVDSDDFLISAGIMAGVKVDGKDSTTGSVKFTDDQDTQPSGEGKPGGSADKKYAETKLAVDFSDVDFTEPGVYRYAITESAPEAGLPAGVTLANPATKYIDVYVERADDNEDTQLTIQGIFLINFNDTIKSTDSNGSGSYNDPDQLAKGSGFENFYGTYDLTVKKTVSGNQASRNKYFQITVTIIGGANDDSYDVDVTDSGYEANPETIAVSGGAGASTFYLKHGESITIEGLPSGTKYIVMEDSEGYIATYGVTEGEVTLVDFGTSGSTYTNNNGLNGDTVVSFNNERDGAIPTGILLTVAPFAALMLLGAAGIVVIFRKKSKAM